MNDEGGGIAHLSRPECYFCVKPLMLLLTLQYSLYMYLHVYVCMYVCMHVCIYVSMNMYIYIYIYIYKYIYIYIYIYKKKRREGPRFRATTVRKFAAPRAAGGLVRLQLPHAPRSQQGKCLSPSPSGNEHEQIRDKTRALGGAPCPLPYSWLAVPALLPGEGPSPNVPVVLAPTAAPQSGPPGTTRNARASALTFLDQQ